MRTQLSAFEGCKAIEGYGGKQVRDNIHAHDLVRAFWHFIRAPKSAAIYNIGGGRHSNCSMIEAISLCERLVGRSMKWAYSDQNRTGDHIWWIFSDRAACKFFALALLAGVPPLGDSRGNQPPAPP